MSTPSEDGTNVPLRPARRVEDEKPLSPKSGPVKVVSIAEPEEIPLSTSLEDSRLKQFPASVGSRRLTGRPSMQTSSSSRLSLASQNSMEEPYLSSDTSTKLPQRGEGKHHPHLPHLPHRPHLPHHAHREPHTSQHDKLLLQVSEWLQREKAKRAARKSSKRSTKENKDPDGTTTSKPRTLSQSSDSSAISLEQLQRILEDNMDSFGHETLPSISPSFAPRRPSHGGRRRSSGRKLGVYSSDTEFQDGDVLVPSCDVVLDNSKTMSYTGGVEGSSRETVTLSTSKRAEKERNAWLAFKGEILRLAHTLRLKGWRRVPLERGGDIEVERLSGALTNAVYVVSPPTELPPTENTKSSVAVDSSSINKYKPPPKLLLRVYGPQVEHLIDRENELGILRRLARKRIGPRLLGTFKNGRFEEYFNAQTLTAEDLRDEGTSKQIAKRMRELHEGIDLLDREREEGPFVWRNWDKWVDRCEEVIKYLDKEILSGHAKKNRGGEAWRERGLVCGVEWKVFKNAVDKYRKWLYEYYRTRGGVERNLVFAHNDTQYGNILRLVPEPSSSGQAPSPLLLPQNTHKQLVVIDFEYASANTPGLEFANHFTEWCYNYHLPVPFACNTHLYPTLEQQRSFIRSYVNHRPQFNPRASATPKMDAKDGLGKGPGSINEFLLDSRTPGGVSSLSLGDSAVGGNYAEEEKARERETERQVDALLKEVKIWRVANSAQWVAWGIVQAKVPELDEQPPTVDNNKAVVKDSAEIPNGKENQNQKGVDKRPEGLVAEGLLNGDTPKEAEQLEDEEDEFDYLGYAQERARFFWGDVVALGLVEKEELPESLVKKLKTVEY